MLAPACLHGGGPLEVLRSALAFRVITTSASSRPRAVVPLTYGNCADETLVRQLLSAGADPNALSVDQCHTTLTAAVESGKISLVRLVLGNALVPCQGALHRCIPASPSHPTPRIAAFAASPVCCASQSMRV